MSDHQYPDAGRGSMRGNRWSATLPAPDGTDPEAGAPSEELGRAAERDKRIWSLILLVGALALAALTIWVVVSADSAAPRVASGLQAPIPTVATVGVNTMRNRA
jgi:hypothetical protein